MFVLLRGIMKNKKNKLAAQQVTSAKSQLAPLVCIYHRLPSVRMKTRKLKKKRANMYYKKDVWDWINNAFCCELMTTLRSRKLRRPMWF